MSRIIYNLIQTDLNSETINAHVYIAKRGETDSQDIISNVSVFLITYLGVK